MNKETRHKRCNAGELEEASTPICLDCPMADCNGSQYCSYLRSRLAEMGLIAAKKKPAKKKPANERTYPAKHYVEYDGKLYTLRQMAEMSGADFYATQNRYYYGWTGREMMQGHRDPKSMRQENNRAAEKYEYEGKFYTVRQMAELCGVSRTAVRKRLRMGWTVKEILQNHREGKKERQSTRTKEAMTHEEQNSGAESERESRSNGA